MYLKREERAGVKMMMYERYVDDSNQVAVVPRRGARYDVESGSLVYDAVDEDGEQEEGDKRLAEILCDIANNVMGCIKMEADWPSRNENKKLPILDMEVWTDENGIILYSHYEKPMKLKTVINSKSAHPAACKRGVHTQEILRRIFNCSRRLDWEQETVPFLDEYMLRMKRAGYSQTYRKAILKNALGIYEKKLKEDEDGTRPLFRNKNWKKDERKKAKQHKRIEWATMKGHIAPIFVPATPDGELARNLRKIADKEAEGGIHFNIIEVGGKTLKSEVQKSNPTETPGCNKDDCVGCSTGRGEGGKCHKSNINYKIECMECPEEERAAYLGETSKNLYTRTAQHMAMRNQEDSFIRKHEIEKHDGRTVEMRARVTRTNRDCLSRQIQEGVDIRTCQQPIMNSKSEWFQPPLFRILNEVIRE